MALRVHVGGAESDSLITVAEADEELKLLPDDTADWDNLSLVEKELRLRLGAQLMGCLPLRGRTVFRNQRLCFPRTCQPYKQRFSIPKNAKSAQAYVSYSVVHRALVTQPAVAEGMPGKYGSPSQISLAGLVSVSFSGSGANGSLLDLMTRSLPFPAYQLLKPYLSQIRGVVVSDTARTLSTTTTTILVVTTTTTS